MYDRYKEILSNYAVDLDFYWFCPHSLQALSKVSIKHLLAAVRVKRGQILPVKTTLFLFFCRSEMYSYHRNNIATIWHMQGKLTTILMQQFFSLNVPERIRQGFDWSVTFSIKCILRVYGLSYWKTNLMLSQIHFNGGSSVAGLGNTRGGGFVFLKHYHCQYLLAWLRCLLPLTTLQFQHFCFPFWFCLNFLFLFWRSFLLTALGTWHFIIVYMCIYSRWWYDIGPLLMLRCT